MSGQMTEPRRPIWLVGVITAMGAVLCAALFALGVWQMQRLAWKTDLIERVEARVNADPVPVPGPADWAGLDPSDIEYRRVRLSGHYLPEQALTQAVTELDGGFWVMTPLALDSGGTVLVNRGFIPVAMPAPAPPSGQVEVAGLMRLTEPGGGFLRTNDPAGDRWYSRDVAAIAAAKAVPGPVAPFFVDASGPDQGFPRGGLTVISFRNSHLSYALTWFALTAMVGFAVALLLRQEYRIRRR